MKTSLIDLLIPRVATILNAHGRQDLTKDDFGIHPVLMLDDDVMADFTSHLEKSGDWTWDEKKLVITFSALLDVLASNPLAVDIEIRMVKT